MQKICFFAPTRYVPSRLTPSRYCTKLIFTKSIAPSRNSATKTNFPESKISPPTVGIKKAQNGVGSIVAPKIIPPATKTVFQHHLNGIKPAATKVVKTAERLFGTVSNGTSATNGGVGAAPTQNPVVMTNGSATPPETPVSDMFGRDFSLYSIKKNIAESSLLYASPIRLSSTPPRFFFRLTNFKIKFFFTKNKI